MCRRCWGVTPVVIFGWGLASLLLGAGSAWGQEPQSSLPAPREVTPAEEAGVQPLEKGPIHEAFAEPGGPTRGEGLTAPKAPPPPVPEEPPESKPEGENVQWIPGYWYWDKERQDFIWISGFWRNVPPDRVWEPGKWYAENGQWVYRPGFWRPASMSSWRVDLPPPPSPVESGPSTPPPSDTAVWIPGHWEYRDGRYVWRAGYWAYANGVMMWHPPQYLSTGSGYMYVPGYWDYPLEWRGVVYTPVYFTQPVWLTPGWRWRPRLALSLGLGWGWGCGGLFSSLYIGPGWNYYYYGNWWDPWWYTPWWWYPSIYWPPIWNVGVGVGLWYGGWWGWPSGYCPWWCCRVGCWNPLWRHYCWLNRNNPNWRGRVQTATLVSNVGGRSRAVSAVSGVILANSSANRRSGMAASAAGVAAAAARATARQVIQREQSRVVQPAEQVVRTLQQANATRRVQPPPGSAAVSGGPAPRNGTNATTQYRPPTASGIPGAVVSNPPPSVRPNPSTNSPAAGRVGQVPGAGNSSPPIPPNRPVVSPAGSKGPSVSQGPGGSAPPPSVRPNSSLTPSAPNPPPTSRPPLNPPVSSSPGLITPGGSNRPVVPSAPRPTPSTPPASRPSTTPGSPPGVTNLPPSSGVIRPTTPSSLPPAVRPSLPGTVPPAVRPSLPGGVPPAVRPGASGIPGIPGGGIPRGGLPGGVRPGGSVRPAGGGPRR
ncbi:MAG: hypothetical protein KatS3mg106_700 [Gemmataceae bacterium]|nr:MAG: hypothetical protein KatS3mg106_700 [Gemmataceae bacterium]